MHPDILSCNCVWVDFRWDIIERIMDFFSPKMFYMLWFANWSDSQDYKHRVGRTARAGRSGVAISLVNQYEVEWFVQIEKFVGRKLVPFLWWGVVIGVSKANIYIYIYIYFVCVSGKKFPEFPSQEEEVLLLMGSVKEAKRVSLAVMIYF